MIATRSLTQRLLASCASVFLLIPICVQGQTADYGPFEGARFIHSAAQGYQEIALANSRWFVAYQGSSKTSSAWVDTAWALRSAQLCMQQSAIGFVALRYVTEKVIQNESLAWHHEHEPQDYIAMHTAGMIYIPIATPAAAPSPADANSKLGAIRCVSAQDVVLNPERLIRIETAVAKAKALGIQP